MSKLTTDVLELRPHHCGISVPDIESSITWYRDILGFSLVKRLSIEVIPAKIAFMKHGDFHIELFEVVNAAPLPESRRHVNLDIKTNGTKHIAFAVEDVRQVVDVLKQRGVDIAMDVNTLEDKEVAFIRDNAGNLIELLDVGFP